MTRQVAIDAAERYVRQLVDDGAISPCEFRAARFIAGGSRGDRGSGDWILDFPFTEEDAAGLVLHVRVNDSSGRISLIESL